MISPGKTPPVEGPSSGLGKWAQRGVPHKGWICIGVDDLGEPAEVCEMCERQEIRYVHYMQHADYPDVLGCGCICAGHMEEDLARARERETAMHNAAARRRNWPRRKGWRAKQNGNLTLRAEGFHITVFRKGGAWRAVISQPATGFQRFSRQTYPTAEAAQLATFDAVMWLRRREIP